MKKFCKNCGNELAEGAKFCPKCGATVEPIAEQAQATSVVQQPVVNNAPVDIKSVVLGNLVMVGAVIMLLGLFIGNFYTTNAGGGYIGTYEIKGFNIPFSGVWYGIVLLIVPIVVLISGKVNALKNNKAAVNLGLSILSLVLVFVLKSQIASAWDMYGSSASLALGSYIYLFGSITTIALSGLELAGFKTDAKSLEAAVKNKNISSMK